MAIQMKRNDNGDGSDNNSHNTLDSLNKKTEYSGSYEAENGLDSNDPENKFRGGLGDGKVDIDKVNDLPAYTAPPLVNPDKKPVGSGSSASSIVFKVIGVILILAVMFGLYKGVGYMTGSSGKDITSELSKSEEDIAKDLKITFEDNEKRANGIPQYANGTITVRSGKDLHVVYLNGKQIGVNTDSRKYRFYGIGINDPEQTAMKKTTYVYDDSMVVLTDMLGGNSKTYFYYNKKNKDCLALTISDSTNRVVNMTYYTDYKKITATLSAIDE